MKRIGIAFGGGGSKGAWQLGVWKALAERGFFAKAVSGTSVGALNAALYSAYGKRQNGWEIGLQAWKTISPETLLPSNHRIVQKLFNRFPTLHNFGLFGNKGIKQLIKNYFHVSETSRKEYLPIFITAHWQNKNKCKYFDLFSTQENYSNQEIENILTASTAIPYVFDPQEIRGEYYCDGGLDVVGALLDDCIETQEVDNCPSWPLLDPQNALHLDMVFALPLNMDEELKYTHSSINGIPVIPIMPSQPLGSCLNFDPGKVEEKLELGYRDAQKILGMLDEQNRISEIQKEAINSAYKAAWDLNRVQNEQSCEFDETFLLPDILKEIENCDDEEELSFIADTFPLPSTEKMLNFRAHILERTAEIQLIDDGIQHIISNANPKEIQDWYIQAHSFLSGIESSAKARDRQNLFQRIFHSISGRNSEEINKALQNLTNANYCLLKLIVELQRFQTEQELQVGDLYNQIANDRELHQLNNEKNAFSNMLLTRNVIRLACKKQIKRLEFMSLLNSLREEMSIQNWQNTRWGRTRQSEMLKKTPGYRFCRLMLDYYKYFAYFINKNEQWDLTPLLNVVKDLGISHINDLRNPLTREEVKDLTYECAADFRKGKTFEPINTSDIIPVKKLSIFDESFANIQQLALNLLERWKALLLFPYNPSCSGMKGRYDKYFEELERILPDDSSFPKYKKRLNGLKKNIADFRLIIYMLGIFSSGKSSLLNAWLGDEYLPEDSGPETTVLLKLQYADSLSEQKLVAVDTKGVRCKTISLDGYSPDRISQTIKQFKDNSSYSELSLYLYDPRLKILHENEIDLADMPGYASGIKGHEYQLYTRLLDQTSNFSFIFCKSQNNEIGLRKEDEYFLSRIDNSKPEIPYCILLTQAGKNHSNIKKRIEKVEVLRKRITELRKQAPLYSGFTDYEEEDGIKGFELALDAIVKQKDHQILVTYQNDFLTLCNDLRDDFDLFCKNCSSGFNLFESQKKVEQVNKEISEIKEKMRKDLLSQNSIQKNSLALLESIKRKLDTFSSAQEMLASYSPMVQYCIKDAVENKFNEIQNAFQGKLGIGILNFQLGFNFSPPPKVELKGTPCCWWHLIGLYEHMKNKYEEKDRQTMKRMLWKHLDDILPETCTVWEKNINGIIDNIEQAAVNKIKMLHELHSRAQNEIDFQEKQRNLFEEKKSIVCRIIKEFKDDSKIF